MYRKNHFCHPPAGGTNGVIVPQSTGWQKWGAFSTEPQGIQKWTETADTNDANPRKSPPVTILNEIVGNVEPFPKPCPWCGTGVGTQGKQNVFLHK